jgi:predicted phosphodiesterase
MKTRMFLFSALLCQPLTIPVQDARFIVVGDSQRASPMEELVGREQNDTQREYLQGLIAKEKKDFIVHLGDMVAQGESKKDWTLFDRFAAGLKTSLFLPVLGNHEYHWNDEAVSNAYERFPFLKVSNWYAKKFDGLGLLFLNSNRRHIAPEEWRSQIKWFDYCLQEMQDDPSIRKIIAFTHHAPFSNGQYTGDDENVQKAFIENFNQSPKAFAFISGHTHSYQHFLKAGKHYVVSGGGGGPRASLTRNDHTDTFMAAESFRPFHYLIVTRDKITVRGFRTPEEGPHILEEFDLALKP